MQVVIFGATGALGDECVRQALAAGHALRVLARTPGKLAADLVDRVEVVAGDALDAEAVDRVLSPGADAILFAIGIDRHSPEDLCTTATRHIFASMRIHDIPRFVWCGGGSTLLPDDQVGFGARFVAFFASTFMGLRHRDKAHQITFLEENRDLDWIGIRPLQMVAGPRKEAYRLGYDSFGPTSRIHFADCAHAMLGMLDDDTWLWKAPIVQY